ncbi:MAG: hypothetical protein GY851_02695 [bacterium]|nr:hypothetical protein [bacterium]
MGSKKRWERVYEGDNPFALPQTISKAVKDCMGSFEGDQSKTLEYLWLYASEDGVAKGNGNRSPAKVLDRDDWLSIIDEAAGLGVGCIIFSLGCGILERPEIAEICQWAQSMHGMLVGLHVYGSPLLKEDVNALGSLDKKSVILFVDDALHEDMRFADEMGFTVCSGEGQDQPHVEPTCTLPESMTCIGASGTMYTCGLVLGEKEYRLGHAFERRLEDVMGDESLPHIIPEGVSKAKRGCNGCPPLMAKRLKEHRDRG